MQSVLLSAVSAAQTSAPVDLGTAVTDDIGMEVTLAGGTPTFTVQLQGSEDGVTYSNLGSAVSAAGVTTPGNQGTIPPVRFLQAVLTYSGTGTVTVTVNTVALN
jgi:hypothetical protein